MTTQTMPHAAAAEHLAEGLQPRFTSAEEALLWATEVLRRRRLPKLPSFWRDIRAEAEEVAALWEGQSPNPLLPTEPAERFSLAMQVQKALAAVGQSNPEAAQLLTLWAWGDWADEDRLRRALAFQEACRQKGMRVRIAYRYTYSQLGLLFRQDKKTVWRHVRYSLALLEEHLRTQNLLST